MLRPLAVQACSLAAQRDCLGVELFMPLRLLCAFLVASPLTEPVERERAIEALECMEEV
jgi:hypothetical protein